MIEALEERRLPTLVGGGGGGDFVLPRDEEGDPPRGFAADAGRFGLWLFLGTVAMLFIGFTSAYMVRRAAADWVPLASPPPILWANTLVILASSILVEGARRALAGRRPGAALRFAAAGVAGLVFLAGQFATWRTLAAAGVFLSSSPHHAFLYVLTGVHALHLLGGLLWYPSVLVKVRRGSPGAARAVSLFGTYWHFLGGLWVYLVLLLFVF